MIDIFRNIFTSYFVLIGLAPLVAGDVTATGEVSQSDGPAVRTSLGPWGEIECFDTVLVAPHHLIDVFNLPPANPQWRFPKWNSEQLIEAFKAMPFEENQLDWLNNPTRFEVLENEIRLHPPEKMITGMTAAQRLAIHRVLRQWEVNRYHYSVFVIESDNASQWFKSLGFSDALATRIAALCFEENGTTFFTEIEFMLGSLTDRDDRHRFLRMLTRTRGLLVRLKLTKESDIESIADYWRGYDQRKSVSPLLESVMFTYGVDYIDIAHLLPPMPRKLLNTFTDPSQLHSGKYPDCFWTALNFFREDASDRMFDFHAAMREVNENYEAATDTPQFGDLVIFLSGESRAPLHAAIYIAADILFTKNGRGLYSPWLMMRKDDLINIYSRAQPIRIEVFRLKQPV